MRRATNYIHKINVFRLETKRLRENPPRHPFTSSPLTSHFDSGKGLGAQAPHLSSSSEPLEDGGDPEGEQVYAPRVPPLAQWLGRKWLVEMFSNNQHVAHIPIACPINETPRFVCPCGVQVYITLDMNDMDVQSPVHLVWWDSIEQVQRWTFTSPYDGHISLAYCPNCCSLFHLIDPS